MNKPELITAVATEAGITKKQAKATIDAFETVVVEALQRGEDVKLLGFVNFTSKEVEETVGRNPQTGDAVTIPAHRKGKATLAKGLRKF